MRSSNRVSTKKLFKIDSWQNQNDASFTTSNNNTHITHEEPLDAHENFTDNLAKVDKKVTEVEVDHLRTTHHLIDFVMNSNGTQNSSQQSNVSSNSENNSQPVEQIFENDSLIIVDRNFKCNLTHLE